MAITLSKDYFGRVVKGGSGSGNFGDGGRPGEVGGSGDGGSSKDTTPLTKEEKQQYLEGDCATFATAGHELTGYPIYNIDTEDEAFTHVMLGIPGTDKYLDAAGVVTEKDLERRYQGDNIEIKPTTLAAISGGVWSDKEVKEATPVVERVLNRIKEFTSIDLPKFNPVKKSGAGSRKIKEPDRSNYFTWQENDIKFLGDKKVDKLLLVKYNPYHGEHGHFASEDESSSTTKPDYNPIKPSKVSESEQEQMSAKWAENLSKNEVGALLDYTKFGYKDINSHLRPGVENKPTGRTAELMQAKVDLIDKALSKASLEKDVVLYRGVNSKELVNQMKPGTVFADHGFVSTSLDRKTAEKFAMIDPETYKNQVMQISVPKGFKAGVIDGNLTSVAESEHEVLLPRSTYFHIDKVSNGVIHARVLTVRTA